jgi:hypothetical protein
MQPLVVEGVAARTLDDGHAALNQALHMTIHHFDVPALFLVDLERLLESAGGQAAVEPVARAWRCRRPLETAAALAAAFVRGAAPAPLPARADRVIRGYGGLAPLPRAEQLRRKVEHFDAPVDALRYLAVQGRRVLRERLLAIARRRRSAAERLGVEASPGAGGPHDR